MLTTSLLRLLPVLLLVLAQGVTASAQTLSGKYSTGHIESHQIPAPVAISVYTPPGYDPDRIAPYPLLIQLHGGGGSNKNLESMAVLLEQAITTGLIEPVVSVMPSAGRSFYMDFKDGSEKWETFITQDLLAYMRDNYNVVPSREGTLITGISMGGMGAIRIAFKHPDKFEAVAGMEPGIEPSLDFKGLRLRDTFWRAPSLFAEIYGDPVDEAYWAANNPATIAAQDPGRLSDLSIYIEAGDQDMFFLHHGTEFLHRILFDAGVSHEYRLVKGAEHVGPSIGARFLDAMGFLGRTLDPPVWINDEVERTRRMVDKFKERAGYPVEPHDPRFIRVK